MAAEGVLPRGALANVGRKWHGRVKVDYVRCVTCETLYPVEHCVPWCNGHRITACPWCRRDTAPWRNGRGI